MRQLTRFVIISISGFAMILLFFLFFRSSVTTTSTTNPDKLAQNSSLGQSTNSATGLRSTESVDQAVEVGQNSQEEKVTVDDAVRSFNIMRKLVNGKTMGASLTADGNRVQFYDPDSFYLLSVNFLGTDPVEIASLSRDVKELIWSPDRQKLIYHNGQGEINYLDLGTWQSTKLGSNIRNIVFISDSQRIGYQYSDEMTGSKWINVGSPDKQLADFRILTKTSTNNELRLIPGTEKLAYFLPPNLRRKAISYAVDLQTGQKEILVGSTAGFDAGWSPNGQKMVFTNAKEGGRLTLFLAQGNGTHPVSTGINSYVDKVVWHPNGSEMYVAVPQRWVDLSDYYAGTKTNDVLYKIDLQTGEKIKWLSLFNVTGSNVDFRNGFFSGDGQLLFFTNAIDGTIYMIDVAEVNDESKSLIKSEHFSTQNNLRMH